ncbi:uncharacterized protein, partial [Halyomorpha halys]|uniref:uncharacterized protein n=1 Tax=Halyomorpha halys TaxID=286706 RepID=UPI0034D384A4
MDDVAVVVAGKYLEEVTHIANQAVATVRGWLSSVGLQLPDHKTEVLLVTSRKQTESITVTVAAQDLLYQTLREQHIDVAILCEQYKNLDGNSWVSDVSGKAAVWACNSQPIQEVNTTFHSGFVWVKINDMYIFSCYAYPSITIEDLANLLDRIVLEASCHKPAIIAGDFNAWATEWGSRLTNRRGEVLLEAFAQISDMILMNTGTNPTFTRAGRTSIIDLTF